LELHAACHCMTLRGSAKRRNAQQDHNKARVERTGVIE
jgi:hypothetical protein